MKSPDTTTASFTVIAPRSTAIGRLRLTRTFAPRDSEAPPPSLGTYL